jgi:hypothetical protein
MNRATPEQAAKVADLQAQVKERGAGRFETRYGAWIGHGCAADRGAVCVLVDGLIYGHVEKDGRFSY